MRQRGFSLIEMMVVILIALFLSLAISSVMSSNEAFKRTTTNTADASQNGNYSVYVLDKAIRDSGSGFRQAMIGTYGCPITATLSGAARLPVAAPAASLPAQFQKLAGDLAVAGTFVMAPVLIDAKGAPDGVSDALIVMSGSSGYGEFPINFASSPAPGSGPNLSLYLTSTVGVHPKDMMLVTPLPPTAGVLPMGACAFESVDTSFNTANAGTTQEVQLGGTYYAPTIAGAPLSGFSTASAALDMGNLASSSPPSLQLFTVGSQNNVVGAEPSLLSYDLLQINSTTAPTVAEQVADGVYVMKAIYGIASATSCLDVVTKAPYPCPITAWVDPSQGTWTLASLSNTGIGGNANANAQIFEIKAVRIGLIMRSPLQEKTAVTTAPVTLFNNLNPAYGTPYVKNFIGNEQYYRYRTVEATIPVRNNLIP